MQIIILTSPYLNSDGSPTLDLITEIAYTIPLHEVSKLNPGWRRDLPTTSSQTINQLVDNPFGSY